MNIFTRIQALNLVIGGLSLSLTSTAPVANSQTPHCDPIGQIVSGNGINFREGQLVCRGDQLHLHQNSEVLFRCFLSRQTTKLQGERVTANTELCASRSTAIQECGSGENEGLCFVPKGPEAGGGLEITQPDGDLLTTGRPAIVWTRVDDADHYLIRVIGTDIGWEERTDGSTTRLAYPESQQSLNAGNAYRIVVLAKQGAETLDISEIVINVSDTSIEETSS